MRTLKCWLTALSLLSAVCASGASADETQMPKHVLGEHGYLPTFLLRHPFSDSHANLALTFSGGKYVDPGNPSGDELKLATFAPDIHAQINVWKALAIYLGINGNIVTGINDLSIIRYGASIRYHFTFGAIYELMRSEKSLWSVSLDLAEPHVLGLSPLDTANQVLSNTAGDSSPDYISNSVQRQWRPATHFVHTFNRAFGIDLTAGAYVNTTVTGSTHTNTGSLLSLGSKFDFDFDPMIGVPLGIALSYLRHQVISGDNNNVDFFSISLFETITKLHNVGLELGHFWVAGSNATVGALSFRTYYN
jgi:hypothetical protein